MKSIKPGRGPSAMGAFGSIAAVLFGIIWTFGAFGITKNAPFPINVLFPAFGVIFVIIGIVQFIYHYYNATSRNRMSMMDIVETEREPDPWSTSSLRGTSNPGSTSNLRGTSNPGSMSNLRGTSGRQQTSSGERNAALSDQPEEFGYCPYCGSKLAADFRFCPKCGKERQR